MEKGPDTKMKKIWRNVDKTARHFSGFFFGVDFLMSRISAFFPYNLIRVQLLNLVISGGRFLTLPRKGRWPRTGAFSGRVDCL